MASTRDLGRIRIVWQGEFNGAQQYEFLDAVSYEGGSYLCFTQDNPPVGTLPTSAAYFAIMSLKGEKGDAGKDFQIKKTYDTVAAMTADYSNPDVAEGDFVIIAGNVEDPDNAKLYVKGSSAFTLLTDLSGAQGFKGETGASATIAVGTVTTGSAGSSASVTNSGTATAAVFNFTLPKGATGDKGDKGSQGDAATITIGTVTTGAAGTNASVVNAGDSVNAEFNFVIPQGIQGIQGEKGNDGADGAGVSILGTLTAESELPSSAAVGDAYLINGDLYVWSSTQNDFVNVGSIKGPKGDDGAKGDKGDTGDTGLKGDTGEAGKSATIAVGSVSTGAVGANASVTNSGTSNDAILNFVIPKGSDGEDGASITAVELNEEGHLLITFG